MASNGSLLERFSSEFHENIFHPVNIPARFHNFLDVIFSTGLFQCNSFTYNSGNVLDLIQPNINYDVVLNQAQLMLTKKDNLFHKRLAISYYFDAPINVEYNKRTTKHNFDRSNFS